MCPISVVARMSVYLYLIFYPEYRKLVGREEGLSRARRISSLKRHELALGCVIIYLEKSMVLQTLFAILDYIFIYHNIHLERQIWLAQFSTDI
jgi:hypothetical protein